MAKLRVDKIAAPIVKDEFTGSVFFDGTGDYLSMPDSTDFDIGLNNEPFTWEAWFYKTAAAGTHSEIGVLRGGGTAGWNGTDGHQYRGFQYTDNTLYWQWWNGSAQKEIISAATPAINTWHHFAVSYDGTTTRAFLNGVVFGTSTEAYAKPSASNITRIGQDPSDGVTTQGYQSNVRICKGHAVYTENFTVPTRELEVHLGAKGVVFPAADNRTIFLACQSSTDTTAEATGRHKITANGNATAADANPGLFRRTNISSTTTETTGSVFFDGTGDYLSVADSDDFHYGSGDFTAECWVYPTASPNQPMLVGQWSGATGSTTLSWVMMLSNDSNRYLRGLMSSNTSAVDFDLVSSASLGLNQWSHCAFVKNGSTFTLYLNGTNVASTTDSDTLSNATNALTIGATSSGAQPFQGYLSNVRVCKGHAVYTSNFAPPTRELEVHQGPDDDRTVLLACYDAENIFADKSGRHIIAAYGDRLSSPTPTATDSPIGITTVTPGLTRNVDPTAGPTFQGGAGFTSQNWLTLPKGTTTDRNRTGGRAVYAGGYGDPAYSNTIEYVNITSAGNGKEFGDLTTHALSMAPTSSSTRGVWIGKETSSSPNVASTIDYVTIASEGNAVDFGDYIGSTIRTGGGVSSSTRGIIGGGATPTITDVIQFITFATLGNGSNFGTLTDARRDVAGAQSTTRGLFAGGLTPGISDIIDFVTIATAGNATDFGDLTAARTSLGALSSHTRAVFGAGGSPNSGTPQNNLDHVTIATLGNATDFGDLYVNRSSGTGTSNKVRGIFVGGLISPSPATTSNTIDYITIASTGNAADFGDAIKTDRSKAAVSDSHGGIS